MFYCVRQVTRAEVKDMRAGELDSEAAGGTDPMENDEFDDDDELMRRTELIETQAPA